MADKDHYQEARKAIDKAVTTGLVFEAFDIYDKNEGFKKRRVESIAEELEELQERIDTLENERGALLSNKNFHRPDICALAAQKVFEIEQADWSQR